MEFKEFSDKLKDKANKINIDLNDEEINNFYKYMNLLLEWNEKMNLTAITEPDEIILKHFVDSLTIKKYIEKEDDLIDVGTGAGFPGIPLSIVNVGHIKLLDSLNKRILFLNEIINELELKNVETTHSRVEDFAKENREKYDIATSRAVAPLNILVEYLMPLVKVGGKCICMKGSDVSRETSDAEKAISLLGGKIENIDKIVLPDSDIERNIVIIRKIKETPLKYPRKAGIPSKEPL